MEQHVSTTELRFGGGHKFTFQSLQQDGETRRVREEKSEMVINLHSKARSEMESQRGKE